MNVSGIPPLAAGARPASGRPRIHPGPLPPPPPEDSLEISDEALQQSLASVPDTVTAAVEDLLGEQTDMAADFRAIGDYFAAHGGRAAQDAFMQSHFTDAQLRAFPPPVDGFIRPPRPPQGTQDALQERTTES